MAITQQIDFVHNYPPYNLTRQQPPLGTLVFNAFYVPGSVSFNNVYMLLQNSVASIAKTATMSLGLYSMNVSTLSLANSASVSWGNTSNDTGLSWYSAATSKTQNVTPGLWYWGYLFTTTNDSRLSFNGNDMLATNSAFQNSAGGLYRGFMTASTAALPASVASANISVEGQGTNNSFYYSPYIIISA